MLSYTHCTLCPRRCGVDRTRGQLGFCKMPGQVHAARAGVHYWEEPVISGSFGSGAVFFSGCTLKCAFCQNYDISQENFGKPMTSAELRAAFERLIDEGVQNINLVTPTHFLPDILPALEPKLPVPVVYNCGGYESVETLRQLEGKIDVYLPDFKYSDNALAKKLSSAPDYFETASAAILEMPKLKSHSGAKKRFNLTKNGKVKRAHAFKSHILTKKTTKRTRNLRKNGYADVTVEDIVKKMIPYK